MANWSKRAQEILDGDDFETRVGELATAAGQAGDLEQAHLCEIALGCGDDGVRATDIERHRARVECARVLWDAEGISAKSLARATGIVDGTGTLYTVCRQAIEDGEGTVEDVRRIWAQATSDAAEAR